MSIFDPTRKGRIILNIYSIPDINPSLSVGVSQYMKGVFDKHLINGMYALISGEKNGLIVTGSERAGKSYYISTLLSHWETLSENHPLNRVFFMGIPIELFTGPISDIKEYVSSVCEDKIGSGEYDKVCVITDSFKVTQMLTNIQVPFILEIDVRELAEVIDAVGKISDVEVVDMDTIILEDWEIEESILLREKVFTFSGRPVPRPTIKSYLKAVRDNIPEPDDEFPFNIEIKDIPVGFIMDGFNKLVFSFNLKGFKPKAKDIKDFVRDNIQDFIDFEFISSNISDKTPIVFINGEPVEMKKGTNINDLLSEMFGPIPPNMLKNNAQGYGNQEVSGNVAEPIALRNPREAQKDISSKILGQKEALDAITNSLALSYIGINKEKGPKASFLFLGPTGVGKSETSKLMAKYSFKEEVPLIQLDMSEYPEKHDSHKLFGAPPGYVGFENGGILINKIKENPNCVLLLDEVEKAHPSVYDTFLQVMEDGRLTSATGETVDFSNVIVIMTSNIGSNSNTGTSIGFSTSNGIGPVGSSIQSPKKTIPTKALNEFFRPEFINRLDSIITWEHLTNNEVESIVRVHEERLFERIKNNNGVRVKPLSSEVIEKIKELSNIDKYGARGISRVLHTNIGSVISWAIIDNPDNKTIEIGISNDGSISVV